VADEFNKRLLSYVRVPAVERRRGFEGCRMSHLAVLSEGKGLFGVFEDDVVFMNQPYYIDEAMSQLPKDWDCLYLGGNPQEEQSLYSENLFIANNVLCTHAIIWNKRKGGAVNYILHNQGKIRKIDEYLAKIIQPQFNCFLIWPLVCIQSDSPSNVAGFSDVSQIVTNYNKYCI